MARRFAAITFVVVALVAGVSGIGALGYQAGFAQGAAAGASLAAPEGAGTVVPRAAPLYYRPFGFGPFGVVVAAFGGLLLIGLATRLAFGRAWMGHGWRFAGQGRPGWGAGAGGIPPMVEEWHRRMDAQAAETARQGAPSGD